MSYKYIDETAPWRQGEAGLNEFGRKRLKYMKEYKKAMYRDMTAEGSLWPYLYDLQERCGREARAIADRTTARDVENGEIDQNKDFENYVGVANMNYLMASEYVCNEYIYV